MRVALLLDAVLPLTVLPPSTPVICLPPRSVNVAGMFQATLFHEVTEYSLNVQSHMVSFGTEEGQIKLRLRLEVVPDVVMVVVADC